jgi:hypothetical protein
VTPLWNELTAELEARAGIVRTSGQDYPSRLDSCLEAIGAGPFQKILRQRYYTELCEGIVSCASEHLDGEALVPDHVRAVAALGQLANPVVSFNIEPISTLLLARPAGPTRILFQQPDLLPSYTWREPGGVFQRLAYHPHGLATAGAVMTTRQYEANRQTLAFGVAIHAAFRNNLVVVGMSLQDRYLRDHIATYRENLENVYWFNSEFSDDLVKWADRTSITRVPVKWTEFWNHWRSLPCEVSEPDLAKAWYLAVCEAVEEVEGGGLGALERSLGGRDAVSPSLRALVDRFGEAARATGEPGTSRCTFAMAPRDVELALRKRLLDAGISLPHLAKTLSESRRGTE